MAYINDSAFDAALNWIKTNGTKLHICSQEPTTYTAASSTYTLGNKTSISIGTVANGTSSGRKVTVPAISDGTVTSNGTATHWALTDGSSTLVATGALNASTTVVSGNPFTLTAFDITLLDAT